MKRKFFLSIAAFILVGFASDAVSSRALWDYVFGLSNATTDNYKETLDNLLLTWRMLPGGDMDTVFDLYCTVGPGMEETLNTVPIYSTNFQDTNLSFADSGDVKYRLTYAENDVTIGEYNISVPQRKSKLPYTSIHFNLTLDVCGIDGMENHADYVGVGYLGVDGYDEIVYGAMKIDHEGVGLYSSYLRHGDVLHLSKFNWLRTWLQICSCFETGRTEVALRGAVDDTIIYEYKSVKEGEMGRVMVADIDPRYLGCELWWYKSTVHDINCNEQPADAANYSGLTNFAIWFDRSLNRQVFTGTKIDNRLVGRVFTIYRYVSDINGNGSKENPYFYGDILGDWGEKLIFQDAPKTKDLKLFFTWIPISHRILWLMADHIYEMSILNQNICYNQSTYTDAHATYEEILVALGATSGVEAIEGVDFVSDDIYYNLTDCRLVKRGPGIYIQNSENILIC